ncbi:HEAT repeat domain-containing protein [bacterium]
MLNQHIIQERFLAYLMNELSFEEMAEIESHIEQCQDCRIHCGEMEKWINLISQDEVFEIDKESLIRARNRFAGTFQEQALKKLKKGFWNSIIRYIPSHIETKRLAMAMAIFIGGLFLGRYVWPTFYGTPTQDILAALQTSPSGTYQIIPSVTDPDQVEFRLRNYQEKTFQGNIQDPEIQTALAYTLMTEERDNVRLRTMDMIQSVSQNETLETALLHTLINDPNPGMRYRAIKLLSQLPINSNMKNLLVRVLVRESNPGVRMQAAEKLLQSQDPDVIPILEQRAKKDEYVQYVLESANTRQALSVSHE